jgi:hypothetical protein
VWASEAGRRIRGAASPAGVGDWDPRGFLQTGAVVRQNSASVMAGRYATWGPHGGARKNKQRELLLRAARPLA